MNFWQGKKVKLRAVEPDDAGIFFEWNQNSERARNLDFVWPPSSRASAAAWAERQALQKLEDDSYHWVIENGDGVPVGSISTHHCDARWGTFSYGIDVTPDHRRKGYAREAIYLVLKYYFEELRYQKVTVPVHSYNQDSILLHQALGFQQEGRHRRMGFTRGAFFDVLWFGMTGDEFQDGFKR
jgi:RimJ/RimL family protein N-acetyltransferase